MSRMRRTMESPLSLFSFQDIVTSVTGIMIFLTLLLGVELIQRVVASVPQQTRGQISASTQSIAEMQAEIADLHAQMQSSGELAEELPSFDQESLQRQRIELQNSNQRLEREIASIDDRLQDKRRQVTDAEAASASEQKRGSDELSQLEQKIAAAKKELELISASNRVFFRKEPGGKDAWVVEIAGARIQVAKLGVAAKPLQLDSLAAFERWLKTMDSAATSLYLIVKPENESLFEAANEAVRREGFDVGFHVMPTDQQVLDPISGAAAP